MRQLGRVHRFVELFLAMRYLRPKRSFVSAITVLSLLGVVCGVGVLIIVTSVMKGFEKEIREKIIGFNAHLTVTNYGILQDWRQLSDLVSKEPGVRGATPFVVGPVLVEINNKISTPTIRGVDVETGEKVIPMKKTLVAGEWLLGPDTILVGEEWARRNDAWIGDKVTVYSPRNLNRLRQPQKPGQPQEYYLPSEYKIAGIFSTGFFEYDFNFILFSLNEAQRLYDLGDSVQGLFVKAEDPMNAFVVKASLNKKLHRPLQALTWMDLHKNYFGQVIVERRVMSFLLFFIMLVAAIGLSSTLITVTVQKTKEIGLMKALGARDSQIVAIFTLYGLIIGLAGSALGVAFGLLTVSYRNQFLDWLNGTFHIQVFPVEIYNFTRIPAVVDGSSIAWIAILGVILSTAAALVPAFAALRVDPATSLHSE